MEIIHLILGKANPDRMNGVNKVVFQLATRQTKAGKNVSVWGITKDLVHDYGERNFETHLFQAYKNPFKLDPNLKTSLIEKKGKAIVHLHGGWIPTYFSVSALLKELGIPFVVTTHGAYNTVAMQRSGWLKKIYFQMLEKKMLEGAVKIHSMGQSEIKGLNSIFPNKKSFLLPYGFETTGYQLDTPENNREFVIGFVGRLDIYTKGLDLLVDAFEIFQHSVPHSKLWIIGDGQGREKLTKIVEQKNLEPQVKFWGSKFGEDKNALLKQMDVFAHPSRNEGLPVSVLEASALKVPSVVSEATNMGLFINMFNAGIVVADDDVQALAMAFKEMYFKWGNNSLKTLGSNAKTMVSKAFDWDHIVNEFDKLYMA
jgi:glycosyltransferase involved in cell wall biosynthesis